MKKYKMTTATPKSITARNSYKSSIGDLEFFDGVPNKATVKRVTDRHGDPRVLLHRQPQ